MRIWKSFATVVAVLISFGVASQVDAQTIPFFAFGNNSSYFPAADGSGGPYSGFGFGFPLGFHYFEGNLAITPTDNPLVFQWESTEPQIMIGFFGAIFIEAEGEVELIPINESEFIAEWSADFNVIGGTGLFANVMAAARPLRVAAVNDPFELTDPEWNFNWTLLGRIRLF